MALISIVIPCYQSALNLPDLFEALNTMERSLQGEHRLEYIAVDDGSGDDTYSKLLEIQRTGLYNLAVVQLARNVGVHNALLAGFSKSEGECVIITPPDLQEPVDLIPKMITRWSEGALVVALVREGRKDSWAEHLSAWLFHRMIRRISLPELPWSGIGTGLLDKRVVQELLRMEEKNSNLIMQVVWLGHPLSIIPYVRSARRKGRSGWTWGKKMKLAVDSIVGFSYFPVRAITLTGLVFGLTAIAYAVVIAVDTLTTGNEVRGWSALMITLLLVSSFQMVALGILGEYLWRTLDATRKRPPYVIERLHDHRERPSD